MENSTPWWASERVWRNMAVWVTSVTAVILIILTFDSLSRIQAGGDRVPPYNVINKRIDYRFNEELNRQVPVIGEEAPLFGRLVDETEAKALITKGKQVIQSRNCMNCHTFFGNGAYYAPDLTKAWLDPSWINESIREELMLAFLQDPTNNARTFGSGRRMPNLNITEEEAHAVIAYLKWMSAIDTNGFPYNFKTIQQGG